MLSRNASDRYTIMGDPNVRNDAYMKKSRMLQVEIPITCPSRVHTPNACFSRNSLNFCIITTKIYQ
jgi:hypothetical protein